MSTSDERSHGWVFVALGVGLSAIYPFLAASGWESGSTLHSVLEVAAMMIAAGVGGLAITRFYSHKENIFLFVGTGFLGTALLDGYHAIVTSEAIAPLLPSDLASLIPWSWVASRLFLSVMLLLAWVF